MSQFIYDFPEPIPSWTKNKADSVRINKMSKNKNRKRHGRHRASKPSYKQPRSDNPEVMGRLLNHHETQLQNNETVRWLSNKSVGTAMEDAGFGITDLVRSTSTPERWSCQRCTFENVNVSQCEICGHSYSISATGRRQVTLMCFLNSETAEQLDTDSWESDLDESLQTALLASLETPQAEEQDTKETAEVVAPPQSEKVYRTKKLDGNSRRGKTTSKKRRTPFASYWADSQQDKMFLKKWLALKRSRQAEKQKKEKKQKKPKQRAMEELLKGYLPPPQILLNDFNHMFPGGNTTIRCVLTRSLWSRFCGKRRRVSRVYHGTASVNDASIARIGLVPGGTHGIPIAHGAAYGRGVYCSPNMQVAKGYDRGSMYVCLATGCGGNGRIYVAPTEKHIVPCYLIRSSSSGVGGQSFGANGALVEFVPPFVLPGSRLNAHDESRQARRRFSDREFYRFVRVS